MTQALPADALAPLRRADAHARWLAADSLALRQESARQLAQGPVLFAGWMDDEEDDEEGPGYEVQDGVATICVEGALMDRACWWWDGYDALQARVERAHADPAVKVLLFDLDSPGGMVAGLFDCMRALRTAKARSGKRCVAWVGSGAYSACYGIASTCDEIAVSDTAGVGSVGVITSLTSYAKMLEENGIDVRVVSSGEEKTDGHGAIPISKAAEGRARARVAELAAMLFAEVGAGRSGLTVDALTALDGGVRYGRAAIAAGLADRVSMRGEVFDGLVARAQRPTSTTPTGPRGQRNDDMDETLLAALVAATGESDAAQYAPALAALKSRADEASAAVTKLSAELAAANDRASAAEQRATAVERAAEIDAAKAARQWTPALDGFLGTLSVEQLRAWRATAPAVVPSGEVKAPAAAENGADKALPPTVAELVARATDKGWGALAPRERHAITAHDKTLAARLRKQG